MSPSSPVSDGPQIASHIVRKIVERTLSAASVLRPAAAQQDLAIALRDELPLQRAGLEVVKARVSLQVEQEVATAARKREQARHELELDELDRRQVRARMDFLRDELLKNPSSARLYTLLQPSTRPSGLPSIGNPEELADQIHQWNPESRWILIAKILHTFTDRLSDDKARDLLKILRSAMTALGHGELATEVAAVEARE
ncbi:hypothetical protein [Streptomyces antimicrobicus]|uniref:Uncharacterized protein n=1 Tax=Streptomyces antimicrobicus TaxID=2883108 RepID=A0ABS8BAL7_9ACTN|nr:hypothetical protein [Streptomyces antimicrobicus]MCB5181660.1 hypothetical protein [Streptomyces antimicrobicus]